jgi:hypothetical protein
MQWIEYIYYGHDSSIFHATFMIFKARDGVFIPQEIRITNLEPFYLKVFEIKDRYVIVETQNTPATVTDCPTSLASKFKYYNIYFVLEQLLSVSLSVLMSLCFSSPLLHTEHHYTVFLH